MSPNYKKSAKDIAFDKERASFRKRSRELEREVRNKELENRELRNVISQKETEITGKDDWIRKLLEYMDLSEEDLKKFIENEKAKADIRDSFRFVDKMFSKYFRF